MNDASRFLSALFSGYPDHTRIEMRCLWPKGIEPKYKRHDGQPQWSTSSWFPVSSVSNAVSYSSAMAREWNVYMGVLPRSGVFKREAIDCHQVRALWCEVDGKSAGQSGAFDMLGKAVQNGLQHPHIVVGSGGGVHPYWLLSECAAIDTDDDRKSLVMTLRRLAFAIGGVRWERDAIKPIDTSQPYADPTCCDAARILRVPGTWNHKPDRQCAVELLCCEPDLPRQTLREWRRDLPLIPAYNDPPRRVQATPAEPGIPRKTLQDMETVWPDGRKYDALRRIVYSLRRRAGWDEFQLMMYGNKFLSLHPGADRRPVENLIRDTVRRVAAGQS